MPAHANRGELELATRAVGIDGHTVKCNPELSTKRAAAEERVSMGPRRVAGFDRSRPRSVGTTSIRCGFAGILAALAIVVAAIAPDAAAHAGGRYGTADDIERTLRQDTNVLLAVCRGFGTPRRRMPGYEQFQEYKHFKCWVVINRPYRQLCLTIHTLRNGRLFVSRRVLAQEARSGDC